MNNQFCPKGSICINNYNAIAIAFVAIIVIYIFNKNVYLSIYNQFLENNKNNVNNVNTNNTLTNPPEEIFDIIDNNTNVNANGNANVNANSNIQLVDMDRAVVSDPLHPPLSRNHYNDPNGIVAVSNNNNPNINQQYRPRMGMPINIETRGSGGDFQQVGILSKKTITNEEQVPGHNTDVSVLPLYGKPVYKGSSRWLYYTETDKYNPVKIPITVNSRDCTDDQGCDELSDNSEVIVPSYNGTFTVKIYKFNKPRYIPLQNPRDLLPLPFT